jgi:hypothetical protein
MAVGGRARAEAAWKASASLYRYVVPDQPDFTMVVAGADLRSLHLEGRYNYEALHAASLFVGFDVAAGERVKAALTPMLGGVFGDLHGLIPALRVTLAWWKLDLYTESEVVIDLGDAAASFVYSWSELGVAPWSWLRLGLAAQRTRLFETPLGIQRGLFAGATYRFATLTLYEFNLGWTNPTYVVGLGISF